MGTFINKCPLYTHMCAKNKNKLRIFLDITTLKWV